MSVATATALSVTAAALLDSLINGETNREKIRDGVKAGKIDQDDADNALDAYADRRVAAAAAPVARNITCKVSEKGAVSIYGLNARFPMTLYVGQLAKLAPQFAGICKFAVDNANKLSLKENETREQIVAALKVYAK